jgi:hypothetical protein
MVFMPLWSSKNLLWSKNLLILLRRFSLNSPPVVAKMSLNKSIFLEDFQRRLDPYKWFQRSTIFTRKFHEYLRWNTFLYLEFIQIICGEINSYIQTQNHILFKKYTQKNNFRDFTNLIQKLSFYSLFILSMNSNSPFNLFYNRKLNDSILNNSKSFAINRLFEWFILWNRCKFAKNLVIVY